MPLIKVAVRNKGEQKPTRYYSRKQEESVSKKLNGTLTPNSGATPFKKGDVLIDQFLLECKTQTKHKESFTIKEEWFKKNDQECLLTGKPYSAVVFNFGPDEKNYYVIDEYLFEELVDKLNRKV